jgi:hypothetical protein
MFGQIYKFTEEHTEGYITFSKGARVILVHRDSKYEHQFICAWTRGIIKFPNNIFNKLELTADHSRYFKHTLEKFK